MLSALIRSRRRYPAVHLAAQLVNQRSVQHGPLVLVSEPRKSPAPTIDRDRTVSRRSEPSSRATLMGEQPNPWDLRPVTNRPEGTFRSLRYAFGGDHPSQTTHQTVSPYQRVRTQTAKGPYFNGGSTNTGVPASKPPAYPTHRMPRSNVKL